MSKFLLVFLVSVTLTSTSLYAMEACKDQRTPTASEQRRPQLPTLPRGMDKLNKDIFNYLMDFLGRESLQVVAKSSKHFFPCVRQNIKGACIGKYSSDLPPLLVPDDFLGAMINLTYLDLTFNHNNTDRALVPLINLKTLKLADSGNITNISGLSSLTCLIMERNNPITDISPLTNLTYLDLGSNEKIKNKGISCLTKLESLSLAEETKININRLTNLKNLTHLSLPSRTFTDEELNNLPPLTTLSIRMCHQLG